jgi:hypothetical protein
LDYRLRFNKDIDDIEGGLSVELYYAQNERLQVIQISNKEARIKECEKNNKSWHLSLIEWKPVTEKKQYVNSFFYTILANYSLYSFNTNEIGPWIDKFFHKNDGYQMPIVINPYRENGEIGINNERVLTRDRLLANILLIPNYIINKKSPVERIGLYYNVYKNFSFELFSKKFVLLFREKILVPLFSKLFNNEFIYPNTNPQIYEYAERYLINKIITITGRYSSFFKYDKRKPKDKVIPDNYELDKLNDEEVLNFVEDIVQDRGHVTNKIIQTLNFLRKNIYTDPNTNPFSSNEEISTIGQNFKALIKEVSDMTWFTEPIHYLPPPFLFSQIFFEDGSSFETLSSGEKQSIFSLNSIIYHIRNVESVHKKGEKRNLEMGIVTYKCINLILDEIELYYHPELQKQTINDLLLLISKAGLKYIENINIMLITHSPFILSDIPDTNILRLENGEIKEKNERTFGSNIHDLLANDFFLTGFMGEFAQNKIEKIIAFLNFTKAKQYILANSETKEKHKEEYAYHSSIVEQYSEVIFNFTAQNCLEIISLIGEPIIRVKLESMFDDVFPEFRKNEKIERLQELAKELNASIRFN